MEKKTDKNGYPLMDSEALCQEALDHFEHFPSLKKYSINGWDYHGHHSTEEFETESVEEAMHRFNVAGQYSYGDCTLYECPNGFRGSCQTISEAGYIEIASER